MSSVTQTFVSVGIHAGKTREVHGHQFVDGRMVFQGSHEQVATLERIFDFYGVLTEEKAELEELRALRAEKLAKGVAVEVTPVITPVVPTEAPTSAPTSAPTEAPAIMPSDDADELAKMLAPGLPEAIGLLDPENDAHWTSNNLPSLDYLTELVGKKVSRGDVDALADGYTRAKARTARA